MKIGEQQKKKKKKRRWIYYLRETSNYINMVTFMQLDAYLAVVIIHASCFFQVL